MNQIEFLNLVVLAERLHHQFLDTINLDLNKLDKRDINDVRAMMLLNIGDAEMSASELLHRGCYLGSNVSYNLGKLTETGYVIQKRSEHDRRVVMVRNSEKGLELCAALRDLTDRRLAALTQAGCPEEDMQTCRQTLQRVQHFWDQAGDVTRLASGARRPSLPQSRPSNEHGGQQAQTQAA